MQSNEIMLKVENVSKVYKLGEIGGTTLRESMQRLKAKIRHKEDPTKKIGAKNYSRGEKFKALDNISFEIKKGERIGIIGHNGAGKSTLLKLISRVTGPAEGKIYLNGRVASMLEVGTGFHPELTGRENIYMNGAILGMTKKEIDAKMEDIIEFSEVRQFIDTPVKRYSSGMYVKLAFSVAAHLDSEIMIMDEVLAVGDMQFQKKCINKMLTVSNEEDKTILYVSHNMNTIRQLCNRVIVLNHGTIIYDGSVEEGILLYFGKNKIENYPVLYDFSRSHRSYHFGQTMKIRTIKILDKEQAVFENEKNIKLLINFASTIDAEDIFFIISFKDMNGLQIGASLSDTFAVKASGSISVQIDLDFSFIPHGLYLIDIAVGSKGHNDATFFYDDPDTKIMIKKNNNYINGMEWNKKYWGNVVLPTAKVELFL